MIAQLVVGSTDEDRLDFSLSIAAKILKVAKEKLANHPDYFEIRPEPSISIEKVRTLIKSLSQKPYQGEYCFSLIHNSHLATTEAQNSLLKILEEPPKFAYIFLTAQNESQLLQTVTSRCQITHLKAKSLSYSTGAETFVDTLQNNTKEILISKIDELILPRTELLTLFSESVLVARNKREFGLLRALLLARSQIEQNANSRLVIVTLILSLAN